MKTELDEKYFCYYCRSQHTRRQGCPHQAKESLPPTQPALTLEQQARNLYDDIDKAYRFQDWDAHEVVVPMIVEALKEARKNA